VVAATLSYSRDNEREADRFSAAYLDRNGIDRQAFVDILQRMGDSAHCRELLNEQDDTPADELPESERVNLCEKLLAERDERKGRSWTNYLSTHPAMQERLAEYKEH